MNLPQTPQEVLGPLPYFVTYAQGMIRHLTTLYHNSRHRFSVGISITQTLDRAVELGLREHPFLPPASTCTFLGATPFEPIVPAVLASEGLSLDSLTEAVQVYDPHFFGLLANYFSLPHESYGFRALGHIPEALPLLATSNPNH